MIFFSNKTRRLISTITWNSGVGSNIIKVSKKRLKRFFLKKERIFNVLDFVRFLVFSLSSFLSPPPTAPLSLLFHLWLNLSSCCRNCCLDACALETMMLTSVGWGISRRLHPNWIQRHGAPPGRGDY